MKSQTEEKKEKALNKVKAAFRKLYGSISVRELSTNINLLRQIEAIEKLIAAEGA